MGYKFDITDELVFYSKKVGLLKKAIGQNVWVIQGVPNKPKTSYFLCGSYIAEKVEVVDSSLGLYALIGRKTSHANSAIPLAQFSWLNDFVKSQSNFSLGFNRLSDDYFIRELSKLSSNQLFDQNQEVVDFDLQMIKEEGSSSFVLHLRRERNRTIVEEKKKQFINQYGGLFCEVCGFSFVVTYGSMGDGFCEVHHFKPLSEIGGDSVSKSLDDLAVVCSNCHRMIHRTSPMISTKDLRNIIKDNFEP